MTPAQQAVCLRRALAHNLTDEKRKLGAAMRDIGQERSLELAVEDSSARPASGPHTHSADFPEAKAERS